MAWCLSLPWTNPPSLPSLFSRSSSSTPRLQWPVAQGRPRVAKIEAVGHWNSEHLFLVFFFGGLKGGQRFEERMESDVWFFY